MFLRSDNIENQTIIDTNEENIPEEFRCPISLDLMKEPVIAADGHSYDKTQINRWFQTNNTSPKTRDTLLCKNLFPNLELRNRINDWLVENGKDPLLPYDPNPSNNIQRNNTSIENMRNNVNDIINRTIDVLEENDIDLAVNHIQDERSNSPNDNIYRPIIQRYWRSINMRPDGGAILNSSNTSDREDLRRYGLRHNNVNIGPEIHRFPGPRNNERTYPELTEEQHFDNQFDEWWRSQRFERGWTSPRITCASCGRVNILRFGCRFCNAPLRLSNRERTANNIQHLYSALMQLGVAVGHDIPQNDSEIMNVQNEIRVLSDAIVTINSELEAVRTLAGNFSDSQP